MGTWGYKIDQSDTFTDVYDQFFEQYNEGATAEAATNAVLTELSDYFSDSDDQFDAYYALALARWETKTLEHPLLERIKQFVESGDDLKNWQDRGADTTTLTHRAAELSSFLEMLQTPRSAKKRRRRKKFDFRMETLVEITAPDGKKVFAIREEYVNGEYTHTSASMMWEDGGGAVFHFSKQGVEVSARWLDAQGLEVAIEKGIFYTLKDNTAFYRGDKVYVSYTES